MADALPHTNDELLSFLRTRYASHVTQYYGCDNQFIREPITDAVLRDHLEGKRRVGTYFDRGDGTVIVGVIDLDNKKDPAGERRFAKAAIDELDTVGLRAEVFASKSKGFHIAAYFADPVPAWALRRVLVQVAAKVGRPHAEIFPKQDKVDVYLPPIGNKESARVGSYINLPFHGKDLPQGRTAMLDKANGLSPHQDQAAAVEGVKVNSLEDLSAALALIGDSAPPVERKAAGLIEEKLEVGQRRPTLFSVAGSMRRRGATAEEILPALWAMNLRRCDPPLPEDDVRELATGVERYSPVSDQAGEDPHPADPEEPEEVSPMGDTATAAGSAGEKLSKPNKLLHLLKGAKLFHAPDGTPYIIPRRDGLNAPYPIRSQAFKDLAARIFHTSTQSTIGTSDLAAVIGALCGKALFDSPCIEVFLRVAQEDKVITVDLGSNKRSAVVITPNGWKVSSFPSVMFRRTPGMLPLPRPEHGGNIRDLRKFLNVGPEGDPESDQRFVLVVCWLLGALRGRGPYGVLVVCGEQGSGKSQLVRRLRHLVDPNTCPLHAVPSTQRDLVILASNSHIMALDNLSFLPSDRSDDFCRIADGGGVATRTLYTDSELTVFGEARPIAINSIEDVAVRGDLLDRAIAIRLPSIAPKDRKTEDEMNAQFASAAPKILGALFDGVAAGLRNIDSVSADGLPRQADLLRWLRASEAGMGWPEGTVDKAFASTKAEANRLVVESNTVARAIWKLVSARGSWSGHANDLLVELNDLVGEKGQESKNWPKAANTLSGKIRRVAPSLRALGMTVDLEGRDPKENRPVISLSMLPHDGAAPPLQPTALTAEPKNEQMSLTTLPVAKKATDSQPTRKCPECGKPRETFFNSGLCVICGSDVQRSKVMPPDPLEEEDDHDDDRGHGGEEGPF